MSTIQSRQDDIVEKFECFEDWQDKYQLLISLGKKAQNFPAEKMTQAYLVPGCQSQVWFNSWLEEGVLRMQGTSDAAIVAGLMSLLVSVYDGQTPQDILAHPPEFIERVGLSQHLSPTRSNGLQSMIKKIMKMAQEMQHA